MIKIKPCEYKPRKRTLYDWMKFIYNLYHDHSSKIGYQREHIDHDCIDHFPSKKLLKRYNLNYEDTDFFTWWLMEQYFDGNLILKEKTT